MIDESDENLMALCQKGSGPAFEELLYRYQPRILRFIERQVGNLEDAKDVTQRTFLQMHESMARFEQGNRFSPWIFTIARRRAIDFMRQAGSRRRGHEQLVAEPVPEGGSDPRKLLSQQEEIEAIWQWIRDNLDGRFFEILWLRIQEDLDYAEIANVLGIREANVRVLLHRARKTLLKSLPREGFKSIITDPGALARVVSNF